MMADVEDPVEQALYFADAVRAWLRGVESEREQLRAQLAAVSAARDEACDIANNFIDEGIGNPNGPLARIAALRAIGKEPK